MANVDGTTGVTVRTYREQDRSGLRGVLARSGEGDPAATSVFGEHDPAVWLDRYADGEPGSFFVAEQDGELLGYLTGCLDTSALPTDSECFERLLRTERLFLRPETALFLGRMAFDSLVDRGRETAGEFDDPRWPSHLHIRLVPEARGRGIGAALMRRWQERLREERSPGCFLQAMSENTGAIAFFERMGFEHHGPPRIISGFRGRNGERLHLRTMVWSP